ncbi:cupin domain-containing protein [Pseudomonas graminis]
MRKVKATIVLTVLLSTAACSNKPPAPGNDVLISKPASTLVWKEVPDSQGILYANVRGDLLGGGPYEAFVRFPGGRDNPNHTHTQTLPTVVLAGTFYSIIEGKTVLYPAGSYYSLPANLKHFSGCRKGPDCLLFQYQADRFDLVPVER